MNKAEYYGVLYTCLDDYFNPHRRQFEATLDDVVWSFKPDFVGYHDGGINLLVQVGELSEFWHFYGDGHLEIRGILRSEVPFMPEQVQFLFWAAVNRSYKGDRIAPKIKERYFMPDFIQAEGDISEGLTGPDGEKVSWSDICGGGE